MRATTTPLENNRVQLNVEVDDNELQEAIDATSEQLSREISIKGFRKGKAPKQLIEARIGGAGALRAEAIRGSLSDFYAQAVSEALIDPIGQPDVEITGGEESGTLTFEAKVDVRPEVELVGYRGLTATIPSPIVSDEEIQSQINRILETDSELQDVDRPIVSGDILLIDATATDPKGEREPMDVEDLSYTVGTDQIAQGIDETIIGLRAGEVLETIGHISRGVDLVYKINIKKVRERILPELNDEWVSENTEYATVEEMREGIMNQLRRMKLVEAQFARRDAAMLALSELVDEDIAPEALIGAELEQRLQDLMQRLEQQGVSFEYFMQVTGQSPDVLVEMLKSESTRAVRVDLALRALVRAEALEPTEEEVEQELTTTATALNVDAEVLRTNLHLNGRTVAFVAEVAKVKASKWLLENVTYIDSTGAEIDRSLLETDQSKEENAYGEEDE